MKYFIGIDVGTGSARAGVFNLHGILVASAAKNIETHRPHAGWAEQSSEGIWASVVASVKKAMSLAGVPKDSIRGLGFDATCSLVVTGADGQGVSVNTEGRPDLDVILWMDHRALVDAAEINRITEGAEVLSHLGGQISPEMELPKLRWFKREMPERWAKASQFWDLPDWLVHRATGTQTRSLCSPVCKWTYLAHRGTSGEGWDNKFLDRIGLSELARDNYEAIGNSFAPAGVAAGQLNGRAAKELGLAAGTQVSSSLIDAYAGALGTLGVALGDDKITDRLAVIAGTSTCHINVTKDPVFAPGVWGPYYSVLLPDLWANEGGQSAAGSLIDSVLTRHGATADLREQAGSRGTSIYSLLEERLTAMAGTDAGTATLTAGRHVQPDFHGNRSPLAEPWRQGAIAGLTLETGVDDLALDYLATIQALAYGTRHILEVLQRQDVTIRTLVFSGGLAKNGLFLRENADATGLRVMVPAQDEPVLLGCAIMGAVASGDHHDLAAAMVSMSGSGRTITPRGGETAAYHDRKYRVYRRMQDDFATYADLMQSGETEQQYHGPEHGPRTIR